MKALKVVSVLLVAGIVVGGLTLSVAYAQNDGPPWSFTGRGGPMGSGFLPDGDNPMHGYLLEAFAAELGIDLTELENRLSEGETIMQIVLAQGFEQTEARTLIQEAQQAACEAAQADGVDLPERAPIEGQDPTFGPGRSFPYDGGRMLADVDNPLHPYMLESYADLLGLPVEELEIRLTEGETMLDVATSLGIDPTDFWVMMKDAHQAALDAAVADGLELPSNDGRPGTMGPGFQAGDRNFDGTGIPLGGGRMHGPHTSNPGV